MGMEFIKDAVVQVMNRAVAGYLQRNNVIVVAVAGSIGKTSTVNAIRTVLSERYKVHIPTTAYNTNRSVHLELFNLPFATSFTGWIKTVYQVLSMSRGTAPYQVVVVEIGTDHPGELASFAWLKPQIGVLTAIAPEHMENFADIDAVAREEMSMAAYCDKLAFNSNTVPQRYVPDEVNDRVLWYGQGTEVSAGNYRQEGGRVLADFTVMGNELYSVDLQVLGPHSLDALCAAAAVATIRDDVQLAEVEAGISKVRPVKGRMQRLHGIKGSTIIDDSYNSSPDATKAALDVLVDWTAPQRIAVLGSMNEMGDYSQRAHREVGEHCDPSSVDLVVTIGDEANEFLAPAAQSKGCEVQPFKSPYAAGEFVAGKLAEGAVVLFKGSQNGVFAEEAIKAVLADPADQQWLVRQSEYWMRIKRQQFGQDS